MYFTILLVLVRYYPLIWRELLHLFFFNKVMRYREVGCQEVYSCVTVTFNTSCERLNVKTFLFDCTILRLLSLLVLSTSLLTYLNVLFAAGSYDKTFLAANSGEWWQLLSVYKSQW